MNIYIWGKWSCFFFKTNNTFAAPTDFPENTSLPCSPAGNIFWTKSFSIFRFAQIAHFIYLCGLLGGARSRKHFVI